MDVARTRLDGAGPVRNKPVTVTESGPMLRSHDAWDEAAKLRWGRLHWWHRLWLVTQSVCSKQNVGFYQTFEMSFNICHNPIEPFNYGDCGFGDSLKTRHVLFGGSRLTSEKMKVSHANARGALASPERSPSRVSSSMSRGPRKPARWRLFYAQEVCAMERFLT